MDTNQRQLVEATLDPRTPAERVKAALRVIEGTDEENAEESGKFLDLKTARKYAGNVSRTTFYRWVQSGLRCYRIRRRLMFRTADIADFIIKNQEDKK